MMGNALPQSGRGIINCKGKVDRMESVFSTKRIGGGTSGSLVAYRIALVTEGVATRSIFLPASSPTPRTHVARIVCSDSLVYVVIREESNLVSVLAYEFDGKWSDAWRISIPDIKIPDNRWGNVFDFKVLGDRFALSIGEYQHNNGMSGLPVATLGRRFAVEAYKP